MREAFRRRMTLRDARAAVTRRSPRPLPPSPTRRTALVLLPMLDDSLRAAWDFVARLGPPDRLLVPVQTGTEVGEVPDRFAGAVHHIGPEERDWRRLPNRNARARVWTQRPDVAITLARGVLGAVLLAGSSPAAVRVGFHHQAHEPFYDLMVRAGSDARDAIPAVERLLRRIDPSIVPFA